MKKLTMADAKQIRAKYAAGGASLRKLGKEFGVSHMAIYLIVNGATWCDLTLGPIAKATIPADDLAWVEELYEDTDCL